MKLSTYTYQKKEDDEAILFCIGIVAECPLEEEQLKILETKIKDWLAEQGATAKGEETHTLPISQETAELPEWNLSGVYMRTSPTRRRHDH